MYSNAEARTIIFVLSAVVVGYVLGAATFYGRSTPDEVTVDTVPTEVAAMSSGVYDVDGEAEYRFVVNSVIFRIDIRNDGGPLSPDDAVLLSVGKEWLRRVNAAEPWREFTMDTSSDSFIITVTAPTDVTDAIAKAAPEQFIKKIQSTTVTPVTPKSTREIFGAVPSDSKISASQWSALTADQQLALQIVAVLVPGEQFTFYAIGCAESGWTDDAVGPRNSNDTFDSGDDQINSPFFDGTAYPGIIKALPEAWKTDPIGNVIAGIIVYNIHGRYAADGDGFEAWSTYNAGGKTAEGTLALAQARGNCLEQ